MGWKIYYGNGSTFSSEDGQPEEAPLDGVQIIVELLENEQRQYHCDRDFYLWTGDCWHSGFEREFSTWVRNDMRQIKYGACISNQAYGRIIKEAMDGSRG